MIVEGYNVKECACRPEAQVMFNEVTVFNEPRFMLTCNLCGNSSPACKTKEQTVHKWNQAHSLLLG